MQLLSYVCSCSFLSLWRYYAAAQPYISHCCYNIFNFKKSKFLVSLIILLRRLLSISDGIKHFLTATHMSMHTLIHTHEVLDNVKRMLFWHNFHLTWWPENVLWFFICFASASLFNVNSTNYDFLFGLHSYK